jgi:hypothetical protein
VKEVELRLALGVLRVGPVGGKARSIVHKVFLRSAQPVMFAAVKVQSLKNLAATVVVKVDSQKGKN